MVSRLTGARRKISSPSASESAFRMEAHPPPTGGSPTPRAPTGVSGSGISSAAPLHVHRHVENRWRLVLVEPRRKHRAVVRVVHPLLADRMTHPQNRAAEHLAAERARMNHRADVGVCEEIHDVVFAGLDVDFDFGEARDIGETFGRRADSYPWRQRPGPGPRTPPPTPWSICAGQAPIRGRRRCRQVESRVAPPAPKSCPRPSPLRKTRSLPTS